MTVQRLLAGAVVWLAGAVSAQDLKVGSLIGDFRVTDLAGHSIGYSALKGDTTVVVFLSTLCPVSNGYNERMNALYTQYSAQGVHFIFVNANSNEPASEVAEHARSHALLFPVYKDPNNQVADLFGAQVTPETFVIDRAGAIRYHGAIDDALNEARIHNQALRAALDAVLVGKPVANAGIKAFGCTIKRRRGTS